MIKVTSNGNFEKTKGFINRMLRLDTSSIFDHFGQLGVDALSNMTPIDTGETASSWGYRVTNDRNKPRIDWYNDNVVDGVNIAIIIQYGHATGNGAYISGIDYINPAIRPIFEQIADKLWKEVRA